MLVVAVAVVRFVAFVVDLVVALQVVVVGALEVCELKKMWLWPIRGWLAKARLSPERDLNAERSSTTEPHELTSLFMCRNLFSCRARGSNPVPLEIVTLQ